MESAKVTPRKSSSRTENAGNDVVELYIWGGDWSLPSLDTESLQALAVTRFSGAPSKIIYCNNPWRSPAHKIPFFRHGDKCFYSARELGTHLQQRNFSCDASLNATQCSEIVTYGFELFENLLPALLYFSWIHEENFTKVIRPHYGYRLPWLYKMWYPERLQKRALGVVMTVYPDVERDQKGAEFAVLERARKCIQSLSEKLGTNEFFLPSTTPTTFDAIVFSYIAPFLKIPLVYNPIKDIIVKTSNLEPFVARIIQRYLSSGAQGDVDMRGGIFSRIFSGPRGDSQSSIVNFDNPTFRKVFWAAFVLTAMLFYAKRLGVFPGMKRGTMYEDDDEDEEYDFD